MSEEPAVFSKGRLEAFSDGVIAVIVTLMVLDLKAPEDSSLEALAKVLPSFLAYLISFIFAALYWINHHGLLMRARQVTTQLIWANHCLLFSLSLFPFATAYMASTHASANATALYGVVQLACGLSFALISALIARQYRDDAAFLAGRRALVVKHRVSTLLYVLAIPATFASPYLSIAIFVAIAAIYVSPNFLVSKPG
jgi:uncharacterized membrane protein